MFAKLRIKFPGWTCWRRLVFAQFPFEKKFGLPFLEYADHDNWYLKQTIWLKLPRITRRKDSVDSRSREAGTWTIVCQFSYIFSCQLLVFFFNNFLFCFDIFHQNKPKRKSRRPCKRAEKKWTKPNWWIFPKLLPTTSELWRSKNVKWKQF